MTRRGGLGEWLALGLVGAVAAALAAGVTPDAAVGAAAPAPARLSSGLACPLTLAQDHKAWKAFEKMLPVVRHPRCFNCHGGVDPFKPADEGRHLGGAAGKLARDVVGNENRTNKPGECRECHYDLPILRNGGFAEWDVPLEPFHFVGKSDRELCNQFKQLSQPDPAFFVGHMRDDNRNTQFTAAAYKGDRHLNRFGRAIYKEATGRDMVPEPPLIPHSQLVAYTQEWTDVIGKEGWKIPDCGCRIMADAWEGRISMVFTSRDKGFGTLTERTEATVRFEIDSSYIINAPEDPALYWKTTSGKLDWSVTATGGECTTSASGSAPIRLGADQNPWGSIRLEPDRTGALAYTVGIGPWPDATVPKYTFRCKSSPTDYMLPGILYSGGWWWAIGDSATVSADGKTIKGTFVRPHPNGEQRWVWQLTLVTSSPAR